MRIKSLLSAAILAVVSGQSHATPITLDFTSLPSAQGWTFLSDAGNTEASVFSVDGQVLTMDSRLGNANAYDRGSAINPALPYVLEARSRAFDGGISMAFSFINGSKGGALYLSPTELLTVNSAGQFQLLALIDNVVFHDFRIEGDFISGYTVSVDGSVVGNGQLFQETRILPSCPLATKVAPALARPNCLPSHFGNQII